MTKSQEKSENKVTTEARRVAAETGKDVCAVLSAMLRSAKSQGDKSRVKKWFIREVRIFFRAHFPDEP